VSGLTARDLRWITDAYEQAQRVRLQAGERIRAIVQGRDQRLTEAPVDEADAVLRAIRQGEHDGPVTLLGRTYRRHWEEENELRGAMEEALQSHPVWPWLSEVRGIGTTLAARLLARLDLNRAPTPSSFWSYCGLATVQGRLHRCATCGASIVTAVGRTLRSTHTAPSGGNCKGVLEALGTPDGLRVAQPSPSRGESATYDRHAKKICYLIGVSFLRSKSVYRQHYDRERDRLARERPEWTRARQHLAALRKMEKLFLSHLWAVWAEAEGKAPVQPYAHAHNLARKYIPPLAIEAE
jgi:transposase IS116/IS110/IS902 family protein